MVAITVILAAVIGTFVLGLGEQVGQNAPQASFTFDYNDGLGSTDCSNEVLGSDGILSFTHDSGTEIDAGRLKVTDDGGASEELTNCGYGSTSKISAGTTTSVEVDSSDTVRLVWTASGGGSSSTLQKWTGPDA